jgi:TetR/AcrR family transcriptional regulator
MSSTFVYQMVESDRVERGSVNDDRSPERPTRERILDAALDQFGTRGYEATSLDDIAAAVGVRKQTVLYWYPSKLDLLVAVIERIADDLVAAVDAALRQAGAGFDRVEATVKAVFRPAVRRPALLGLVRELNRLGGTEADHLLRRVGPLVGRAVQFLEAEMEAGRMRRADPRLTVALAYATVVGIATEPEALRAVGWEPTAAGLRRLRTELVAYLRAALT